MSRYFYYFTNYLHFEYIVYISFVSWLEQCCYTVLRFMLYFSMCIRVLMHKLTDPEKQTRTHLPKGFLHNSARLRRVLLTAQLV